MQTSAPLQMVDLVGVLAVPVLGVLHRLVLQDLDAVSAARLLLAGLGNPDNDSKYELDARVRRMAQIARPAAQTRRAARLGTPPRTAAR